MIVWRSTYDLLHVKHVALVTKWNALVNQINKKGQQQSQFTQDEIKVLVKLCHPDKHQGNKEAEEITKKLLELRNK